MPAVSEQFKTYYDFASASLKDIYGDRLNNALKLKASELRSGIWLNQLAQSKKTKQSQKTKQKLHFIWQPLPWEAQLAPVNAIVAGDFNKNGNIELILAQNHSTNWLETGPWNGATGCHIEWKNKKPYTIFAKKSGITMPNDTKSLLKIDTNQDGKMDILAGQNNAALLHFQNQTSQN